MMGWDANGVPLDATLLDHQLDWLVPMLSRWAIR